MVNTAVGDNIGRKMNTYKKYKITKYNQFILI